MNTIKDLLKNKKRIRDFSKLDITPLDIKANNDGYFIIGDNIMENATELECVDYDLYNDNFYKRKYITYNKLKNKLDKNFLHLDHNPTPPPQPSNYQRYCIFKKRNKFTNCLIQSSAILYLIQKGYKLVKDKQSIICDDKDKYLYFESYESIEKATDLAKKYNDNILDTLNYTGYYNIQNINNNVPIYKLEDNVLLNTTSINSCLHNNNNSYDNDFINNLNQTIDNNILQQNYNNHIISDSNSSSTNTSAHNSPIIKSKLNNKIENNNNNIVEKQPTAPSYLVCSIPEHHNTEDKINYYNKF